jgi:hypothetical protein
MLRKVDPNSIAARLRAALQATNHSASDLARTCGFSRQNMQRFLDGEIKRSKHYPTFAKALGVSLSWLVTGHTTDAPSWSSPGMRRADGTRSAERAFHDGSHPGHSSEFPSHWRITTVSTGMQLALSQTQFILDAQRVPEEGDLVLLPSKDGPRLRRLGPTIAGQVVLMAVDGSGTIETKSAPLNRHIAVVVGTLFTSQDG